MVLGVLKPILSPLLPPAAPNAAPNSAVGRAAAAQQAAREAAAQQAEAQQQNAPQAQPEGVTFDLSDKALQLVEDAAAAQSVALPPATQAPAGSVAPSAALQTQPASTAAAAAPALHMGPRHGAETQTQRRGWGFDLEWTVDAAEAPAYDEAAIQRKMEACIDTFEAGALEEEREGGGVSATQEKKRVREELLARRAAKARARLTARRGGG